MTNDLIYIREIVHGLISALSKKDIERLYEEHKNEVKAFNKRNKKTSFGKNPCPSLVLFKSTVLPSVVILKLQDSIYSNYLSDLSYNEVAFILGNSTSKETVIQIENKIMRIMKHPKNRKAMDEMKRTSKEISSPTETVFSIF